MIRRTSIVCSVGGLGTGPHPQREVGADGADPGQRGIALRERGAAHVKGPVAMPENSRTSKGRYQPRRGFPIVGLRRAILVCFRFYFHKRRTGFACIDVCPHGE